MPEHRWTAVALVPLDAEDAARFVGLGFDERRAFISGHVAPSEGLPDVKAVRGPICSECRVSYEDVARIERTGTTWPCPGVRPEKLGGPLEPQHLDAENRQQRRANHRAAAKAGTRRGRQIREAAAMATLKKRAPVE